MKQKISPYHFFLKHAGFCWNESQGENREQGRRRCAKALAKAEKWGSEQGVSFQWELDGGDSREWKEDGEPVTPTWQCIARDAGGKVVSSLGGIDFGDGKPWGDPYRRVVEVELALELEGLE